MLHAILSNKAGHSLSSDEVHWRQLFTASENSLTSTIFGALLHLPVELFWRILSNACYGKEVAFSNSKFLSYEFWPHWGASGSSNTRYIEPDIFIRTDLFDLVVEAKRFDENQQSIAQWINEFSGYLNEYSEENKKVILLAIGGIDNEETETIQLQNKSLLVIKCRWIKLLQAVKDILANLEKSNNYLNNIDSTIVILKDIVFGFGIHGYATGDWFETQDFAKLSPITSYELLDILKFK